MPRGVAQSQSYRSLTGRRVGLAIALAALVAVAMLSAGGESWAGSAKPKFTTTSTFHLDGVEGGVLYHGRLKSDRHVCEARRRLELRGGPTDAVIASFRSKQDGRWQVFQKNDGLLVYKLIGKRKETPHVICKRFVYETDGPW